MPVKGSRMAETEYGKGYAAYQLKSARSWVRSRIRSWYLRSLAAGVAGPAIDFGCGLGGLLALLPEGSQGLEINPHAVAHWTASGLRARLYDPGKDGYRFAMLEAGRYTAFIISHVLEHLDDPAGVFAAITSSCRRLRIGTIIVAVPQTKGFRFDPTHKTFIDRAYLAANGLLALNGYAVRTAKAFPFPEWMGGYFTHNELRLTYAAE